MNKHCLGADIVLLASIYYYVSVILSVAINKYGGAKRSRTVDPLHAMQVLYQLSYSPSLRVCVFYARPAALSTTILKIIHKYAKKSDLAYFKGSTSPN